MSSLETVAEISKLLLSDKVTLKNCISSKENRRSVVFELDDAVQYVNLKQVKLV